MENGTKVVTGKVRGSYVSVFHPKKSNFNDKEEYSMTVLIPKEDKTTVEAIKRAIKAAAEKKWGSKIPPGLRNPLRDEEAEAASKGETPRPEYAGHFFINVKSKDAPGIVDARRQQVLDPKDFMSGDYCRVSMNAYPYEQAGNRGVAFGLGNIQVLEKGAPLGGRTRAEDDFSEWGETSTAEDIFG